MIGTSIGRYEVQEELGQGGMSVVYRGLDKSLEREVAIKVLHSHLAKKSENRQRLHREAKAIARLKHPNILEIYDYGAEDENHAYIVMEYVPGQNLRQFLQEHGPLPAEHCAMVGLQLSHALWQAHSHGIIHRDLKPENVMVSVDGALKLMDFGIAHVFDAETMTQTGSLLGSPAHMAPEMIEGDEVDARADIFALGTVLYLLATGELPFDGKNAPQILKRVLEGLFKNPEAINPKVGSCFGDIIRRCMAYRCEDRYANVEEVAKDLERFLQEAQIDDPRAAMRAYLLEPEQERDALEARIVARLLKQSREALAAHRPQEAFKKLNRVLGYEPQNVEVQAQLAKMQRRFGPLHLAVAAAVLMLSIGVAYGVQQQTLKQERDKEQARAAALVTATPDQEDAPNVAASRASQAIITAQTQASAQASLAAQDTQAMAQAAALVTLEQSQEAALRLVEVAAATPTTSPSRGQPNKAGQDQGGAVKTGGAQEGSTTAEVKKPEPLIEEPKTPQRWSYRFKVLPPTASLFIAGEQKSALEAMTQGVELERGTHQIKLSAPGCVQHVHALGVTGPPRSDEPIPLVMTWRPGVVQIKSDVPSTIFIDGSSHGTIQPGQLRAISFHFGKADEAKPEKQVTVVLYSSKDMTRSLTKEIKVRPGNTQLVQGTFLR